MAGAERRRHRVFATQNTEYHLRDDECVGVFDRHGGRWIDDHMALRLRALQVPKRGSDSRWLGNRLQFWGNDGDVLTSPVVEVLRPPKRSLDRYVSRDLAGEFACA